MKAATAFESLPIVDVSALESGDASGRAQAVEGMRRAARDVGFLYVTGHGVPPELVYGLERAARAFFALPAPIKHTYYIGLSQNHRGYVPPGEEVFYGKTRDSKEAFDLSRELPARDYGQASRFLGPNVWPKEIAGFREAVEGYYEAVFALGQRLLRGFASALDLPPEYFDGFVRRPPSQLRMIHYPGGVPADEAMGIGAHTDYECFTILHATAPGLQVMNGQSRWVDAAPLPSTLVINIGDLLQIWSNGAFVSTSHRVLQTQEERYSFPFFFNVDYETRVAPLPHLCCDGPRYPAIVAGEHLLAQTMQSFSYLQQLVRSGRLTLPEGSLELSSFGRDRRPADT